MNVLFGVIAVLLWLPAMFLKLILAVPGLAVVAIQVKDPGRWARWAWLWADDELLKEGSSVVRVLPQWWVNRTPEWSYYRRWYHWHALRNTVSNAKFMIREPDDVVMAGYLEEMEAGPMQKAGRGFTWRWTRGGVLASLRLVWVYPDWPLVGGRYGEFWIGFKVGSPVPGVGITLQPRFFAKIGQ